MSLKKHNNNSMMKMSKYLGYTKVGLKKIKKKIIKKEEEDKKKNNRPKPIHRVCVRDQQDRNGEETITKITNNNMKT